MKSAIEEIRPRSKSLEPPRAGNPRPAALASQSRREQWAGRYHQTRAFTEELCQPLQAEDYVIQSMPDASPAKWHLAHTSWFFETFVLKMALEGYRPSPALHSFLFNSYYNAVGPMHCRAQRGMITRPTVEETYQYREQVDAAMMELIDGATEEQWEKFRPVIELGLNHEQQHQELLLTDIKHLLAQNPLYPVYAPGEEARKPGVEAVEWHPYAEGIHWIGHDGEEFAFDNEGPRHREFLESFHLSSRLVTNGEYLAFIEDDGYARPELWLSLGWLTAQSQKWTAPLYWECRDGDWFAFTLSGLRKIDPNEPVAHVSYFEADAFARWAGARLPTEAEWEVASAELPLAGNFAEARHFHPLAVADAGRGQPAQMFGDLWEWTRSSYAPYPRFKPEKGAIGEYNGKFMCNQYVLRGGSCATSQSHIRRTYRNFFAPDKRWQFMGIRLANDML